MTRGGERKGAGRKKGEPTKQVRIPVAAARAVRALTDYFLQKAKDVWTEKYGEGFNVYLSGIEKREARSMIGTKGEIEVLVCHAEKDSIRSVFTIDFDTGKEGFQYEDELDI